MRKNLAKAALVLAGLMAFGGIGVGAAQAQDRGPWKTANMASCITWGNALVRQGKIKGFRCDGFAKRPGMWLEPHF